MNILQDIIQKSTSLGNLQCAQGLGIIPILSKEVPELQVLEPLESALERGVARITETSPAGEVPFLMLENTGDCPIIILDGEGSGRRQAESNYQYHSGDSRKHGSEDSCLMHSSRTMAA